MRKILLLACAFPMLVSVSGAHYSNVFGYSGITAECVQEGTMQHRVMSNDNVSIVYDVNLTYEMYKLPTYAPYIEKHQTYWFTYSFEVYLYGEGYYKNGLGNWFTEAFNSHFEQGHNIFSTVVFSNNVKDSVFYTMAKDGLTQGMSKCRAVKNFRNGVSYSTSGNNSQAYSQYRTYFYKYLETDNYMSEAIRTSSSLKESDYEPYWVLIGEADPLYNNTHLKSDSDYAVAYNLFECSGFPEGVSSEIGVSREEKKDLSFKFYDQFCIDTSNISGKTEVEIKPSFTILEGNATWYDTGEYPHDEPFRITLNF